jgi:hypothetical protein
MLGEQRFPFDPTSYSYQEMIGQVPSSIRLGTFRVHAVIGVPSTALGANGDFALRTDGTAGANTTIYHKEAGAWVGLTA